MACWMCKCEGKARPPSGFPLRDLGNNPLLQLYLLFSLKDERGQGEAAMCVFDKPRLRVCIFCCFYLLECMSARLYTYSVCATTHLQEDVFACALGKMCVLKSGVVYRLIPLGRSWHWVTGGVRPRQVTSLTQGWHIETKKKTPFPVKFTPKGNLETPINLICPLWQINLCGRKPE